MLVLAPAACCLAGIGADALLSLCLASLKAPDTDEPVRAPAVAGAAATTPEDRSARRQKQRRPSAQAAGSSILPKGLLSSTPRLLPKEIAGAATLGLLAALIGYTVHCVWVSAEMYSAPSIVLQTRYGPCSTTPLFPPPRPRIPTEDCAPVYKAIFASCILHEVEA